MIQTCIYLYVRFIAKLEALLVYECVYQQTTYTLVRRASVKEATSCADMPSPCSTKPRIVIHSILKTKIQLARVKI